MKPISVNKTTKATFNMPLHGLHAAYSTTPKYTGRSKSLYVPDDYNTKKKGAQRIFDHPLETYTDLC